MFRTAIDAISKAKAVWQIIKTLSGVRILETCINAVVSSLNWWDWLLFGVMLAGTILAAFFTGGAAIIGMIVLTLTSLYSLGSHTYAMIETCFLSDAAP